SYVLDQPFAMRGIQSSLPQPFHMFVGATRFDLTQSLEAEFTALYQHAKRSLADPSLETATTRFDDSHTRTKDEDRLVDYWIALESLFFPKDEQARELRFAVALAISHYLGR